MRATTVLSFPQPTPLLWRTDELNRSHNFSRQISPFCVLCSIVGMCSFGCCMEGDGEGGKRGTGGENPEGEGGLQPGCPPFPGLSPQDIGKPVLRGWSTQSIKERTKAIGCKHACAAKNLCNSNKNHKTATHFSYYPGIIKR